MDKDPPDFAEQGTGGGSGQFWRMTAGRAVAEWLGFRPRQLHHEIEERGFYP
jgi:hypothetical protein